MLLLSQIPHGCESSIHDFPELIVDFIFCPAYGLDVLYPFEVGDDNAAGVCKNIRYDQDSLFGENRVGFGGDRSVCGFNDQFCLDLVCVVCINLVLQSGRDQDSDIQF